ncbi:MAG: methyltransferase domain-containing protein [Pseudomonadales bacterium]|nr:methyltransferase domain-containing protein [Pseudomonadales bacterium]
MAEATQVDREKLEIYLKQVSQQVMAGFNCSLSHVGDKLGLYRKLRDNGPVTSMEFAEATGLHERWLREWLRHQACVGQIDYSADDDSFSLSPEAAIVLCDDENPFYFAAGFQAVVATHEAVPKLGDSFRTGLGLTYDEQGEACACGIERLNNYVPRNELVQNILPSLSGVTDKLVSGARVADVGCGAGQATLVMAEAFPESDFVGYDTSDHALANANAHLKETELKNARFVNPTVEPLPRDGSVDFVTTFDVIHDAPYPGRLIADIHRCLNVDGTWLCSDIRSFPTFAENLRENPSAGLFYGFSLMICMSSSMSTPDGAGLGTLGFNEQVAREMSETAGFSRFARLEFGTAVNNYYEIRP